MCLYTIYTEIVWSSKRCIWSAICNFESMERSTEGSQSRTTQCVAVRAYLLPKWEGSSLTSDHAISVHVLAYKSYTWYACVLTQEIHNFMVFLKSTYSAAYEQNDARSRGRTSSTPNIWSVQFFWACTASPNYRTTVWRFPTPQPTFTPSFLYFLLGATLIRVRLYSIVLSQ